VSGDPAEAASHPQSNDAGIPRATYRVQLNSAFTFADAARVLPYLARLGISHLYVSPILKARPGSTHGYDVTDHTQLNPELGGAEGFQQLTDELRRQGMGLIVDIVPNHLGILGNDNQWWLDVLENGPAAEAADAFDIDWRPQRASMRDRLLVPVLGDPYGTALERGDIRLAFDASHGEFSFHYHEHRFPVDPRDYPQIFADVQAPELDELAAADFSSLLSTFGRLPPRNDVRPEVRTERYRDKEAHKRRLMRLIEREPALLSYIEAVVAALNGVPGNSASFDRLDALHESQAYRLAFWRVAQDEINYRRFFDVNSLAALRMNEERVFADTHRLILELIGEGRIQGLRIDHSDGLFDPEAYFGRLRSAVEAVRRGPDTFFIVTEKIVAPHERLPESWPLQGTTGYDFSAQITSWLVDGSSEAAITRAYQDFIDDRQPFEDIAYHSRKLIMRIALAPEIEGLATQLDRIARLDRHTADFTRSALREAVIEVIACFPVYRTYVSARGASEEDRKTIDWAVSVARKRSGLAAEASVFEFLRQVLLVTPDPVIAPGRLAAMQEFAMKFQQVTAPVTAKGVEDTALYRFNRLVCLNDVGADPRRYSLSTQALHHENSERARRWPHALLTTSTHDSKRSEDVRARIAVLSETPQLWRRQLSRWTRLNRSRRIEVRDAPAPDSNDEYLLYQTLLGIWDPDSDPAALLERMQAYAVKAAREAKRMTSWLNPDTDYEQALQTFLERILQPQSRNVFLRELQEFARTLDFFGQLNSLAQLVIKLTAPGVPDFYQGGESQTLTLVDPDNRRPVDFESLERQLAVAEAGESATAGMLKLRITQRLLKLRRDLPALFSHGSYVPLTVEGEQASHLLAFMRAHETQRVVVIVSRGHYTLTNGSTIPSVGSVWGSTVIHLGDHTEGPARDVLTGGALDLAGGVIGAADALLNLPFAVLVQTESPSV
jgi:(1->4)-alpha-D-glucan 1-alpha-D-glucosylmutase